MNSFNTPQLCDRHKIIKNLTSKQKNVFNILMRGGKYSAADITLATHYSDPRSIIRKLRKKGIAVLDEWRENAEKDGHYKVYYINPEYIWTFKKSYNTEP